MRYGKAIVAMLASCALACALTACGGGGESSHPTPSAASGASPGTSSPGTPGSYEASDMAFNGPSHDSTAGPDDWGDSGCDPDRSIRVITVRGTGEALHGSMLDDLADRIAAAFPDAVQVSELDYPASWHSGSAADGVNRLVALLNGTAIQCPAMRTAVLGYSQGAMVVGDALSEPQRRYNEDNATALTDAARRRLAVAELFGDPRFDGAADYGHGDYDRDTDGILGARDGTTLGWVAARLRSYCTADDFACQAGGSSAPHGQYPTDGSFDDAARFASDHLE